MYHLVVGHLFLIEMKAVFLKNKVLFSLVLEGYGNIPIKALAFFLNKQCDTAQQQCKHKHKAVLCREKSNQLYTHQQHKHHKEHSCPLSGTIRLIGRAQSVKNIHVLRDKGDVEQSLLLCVFCRLFLPDFLGNIFLGNHFLGNILCLLFFSLIFLHIDPYLPSPAVSDDLRFLNPSTWSRITESACLSASSGMMTLLPSLTCRMMELPIRSAPTMSWVRIELRCLPLRKQTSLSGSKAYSIGSSRLGSFFSSRSTERLSAIGNMTKL